MNGGVENYNACEGCMTRVSCYINDRCGDQADSAEVAAPTPAADAQDPSYRAETAPLGFDIALNVPVQSKLPTEAEERHRAEIAALEQQRDQYQAAMLKQNEVNNELYLRHQAETELLTTNVALQTQIARDSISREAQRKDELARLKDELVAANDSLIAAREQIAALVAEQRESDADKARALREYTTTKQFHQQQASMAPAMRVNGHTPNCASLIVLASYPPKYQACDCQPDIGNPISTRGVSIPAAELEVTEQEDEAFAGMIKTTPVFGTHPNYMRPTCFGTVTAEATPRPSEQIRLDNLEHRVTRVENAYLVQQGRINTAHDRLDGIVEAAQRGRL